MKTATNRKKILNYFAGMENLASAIGNGGLADIGDLKSPYSPPANCKFAGTGNYERTDNSLSYVYRKKEYSNGRFVKLINDPNRKGAHETAIIKAEKLTPSARSSYPEGNVHHLKK